MTHLELKYIAELIEDGADPVRDHNRINAARRLREFGDELESIAPSVERLLRRVKKYQGKHEANIKQ